MNKQKKRERFLKSPAVTYARFCVDEDNSDKVPKYVRLQAQQWLKIVDEEVEGAYIDLKEYKCICKVLKLMQFPDNINKTIYDVFAPWSWLLIVASLCTFDDNDNYYYRNVLLIICRKNYKTFTTAVIMIYLLIKYPKYSRFYTVSPSSGLSKEISFNMTRIIANSPALQDEFKSTRDFIKCKFNNNTMNPLSYVPGAQTLDGKLATIFIADEILAIKSSYPVEAMRSSQINLTSAIGFLLSTIYPNNSPLLDELDEAKKLLKGDITSENNTFALLYIPDEEIQNEWQEDDRVLYQSNPVLFNIDGELTNTNLMKNLLDKRQQAILYENKRENFLCKHCNIQYKGSSEQYISSADIEPCSYDRDFDWTGRKVTIGCDLASVDDNTAVVFMTQDPYDGEIYTKTLVFIPEQAITQKTQKEQTNYERYIKEGNVIATEGRTVDYTEVENKIVEFIQENELEVQGFYYDVRNCEMLASRLENVHGLPCVAVAQHSSVLSSPLKFLKKNILDGTFHYIKFDYVADNFMNAQVVTNTNEDIYLSKKKSSGKIDIVMAHANAMYGLMLTILDDEESYIGAYY